MQVEIRGLEELIKKCSPNLYSEPLQKFFRTVVQVVQSRIVPITPRMTGKLRRNIKTEVDGNKLPKWGRVYTPLFYGYFAEKGTRPHKKNHPGSAGHWMFERSKENSHGKIRGLLDQAGREIKGRWEA